MIKPVYDKTKHIYIYIHVYDKTKQIFLPYVPVYDKTKKEIVSLSAGKSGFAVNEVSELERTVNSLCNRIHYRFKNVQTRLNKLINLCKLLPYVPAYDKTKKEIISNSAGKSVDTTDINHGHTIVN